MSNADPPDPLQPAPAQAGGVAADAAGGATCAVVCNVSFMVVARWQRMNMPSGVDEDSLELIRVQDLHPDKDALARHQEDIARLRTLPGVQSVAVVDSLPFSDDTWSVGTQRRAALRTATISTSCSTTARRASSRRWASNWSRAAISSPPTTCRCTRRMTTAGETKSMALIVSSAVAEHYFPGQSAVGKADPHRQARPTHRRRVRSRAPTPSPGDEHNPDYIAFAPHAAGRYLRDLRVAMRSAGPATPRDARPARPCWPLARPPAEAAAAVHRHCARNIFQRDRTMSGC